MTSAAHPILAEVDTALSKAPASWHLTVLRRITDLFIANAELYGGDQVALFGEVMCRLIAKADRVALAELSAKLAPVANAPAKALDRLARHPDIAVSGPLLEFAAALPDEDLVAIADTDRADLKLLAKIAARPKLSAAVTDVLLKRGNRAIQRKVIDNPNACISEMGFARLINGLKGDKDVAAAIAVRPDVPAELRMWLNAVLNP
jgi:uncharacterized protein (DUF2336 family)